jgi:protein-tyrosine-phosphatase
MSETISRKSDVLRRVLFLCADNYHESRFCEELFNSHARTEGLSWQATSRALQPAAATRSEGPMSERAIAMLRTLGAAPVNHLRLPLHLSEFDIRMSSHIIVVGAVPDELLRRRVADYAAQLDAWDSPASDELHSQATLMHLARKLATLLGNVKVNALPLRNYPCVAAIHGH